MAVRWCKIGDTSEVGRHFCFAGIAGPSEGCTRFGGLMRIWHRETGLWGEKGICWFYYRGKLVASNYILMIKLFLYFIVLSIFWRDLRKLKISERVKELFVRLCVWRLNLGTFPPPPIQRKVVGPHPPDWGEASWWVHFTASLCSMSSNHARTSMSTTFFSD